MESSGVDIPVVFDGLYCLLIGYLIIRSTFLPRILGALIACAGFGWLTFLSPRRYLSPYNLALGILGQGSVMLWLLMMGVTNNDGKSRPAQRSSDEPLEVIYCLVVLSGLANSRVVATRK